MKEDLLDFIDQHLFPARYQLVTDLIDYGKKMPFIPVSLVTVLSSSGSRWPGSIRNMPCR